MFPLELLADLPNPRDDEPASLRIDIVDELTDHLHCAFRREVLRDGDEAAARRRTLDRFGDPIQLARRLWWQAMWSRIMRQRIVSALQWSVALAAILISGAVFWQQSQMLAEMRQARQEEAAQRQEDATLRREDAAQRQALAARIGQLQILAAVPTLQPSADQALMPTDPGSIGVPDPIEPPHIARNVPFDDGELRAIPPLDGPEEAPTSRIEPPQLTVQLVQEGADGSPIALGSARVSIADNRGTHRHGDRIPPTIRMPATGKSPEGSINADPVGVIETLAFGFQSLDPGHYDLTVELADGQHSVQPVLIRDNTRQVLIVACPPPRQKASLQISVPPLPKDLREAALYLDVKVVERPVIVGEIEWLPKSEIAQALSFDPKTARTMRLTREDPQLAASDQRIDLRKVKPEDCLVFVDSGAIALNFQLGLIGPALAPDGPHNIYPVRYPAAESQISLMRDANAGENRWQLELPDELLAAAREKLKSLSSPRAAYDPSDLGPGPENPPAQVRKSPQLTIKCVTEGENASPAKVYQVAIRCVDRNEIADRIVSGEDELYVFEELPPDQYELTIVMADQQFSVQPLLVADEKPRELTIVCPGPRKKVPVGITIQPLPEKLLKVNLDVQMVVGGGPVEIGKHRWVAPNLPSQTITFDPKTGLPRVIEISNSNGQQHFDLSGQPADERRVFLPVGTAYYHFRVSEHLNGPGSVPLIIWPNAAQNETSLKRVIQADEKSWNLELPQEYLKEIVKEIHLDERLARQRILKQLNGTWRSADDAGAMVFEFAGEMCRVSEKGEEPGIWYQFILDATKDPCWININGAQGIFGIKDDELTICLGPVRPTGLQLAPGGPGRRHVLKREKSDTAKRGNGDPQEPIDGQSECEAN